MITFEFDRAKMQTAYTRLLVVCLSVVLAATVSGGLLLSHAAAIGLPKWVVQVSLVLILLQVLDFVQYGGVLHRGLRKRISAVIINHTGVTDNASQFALGQLEWNQIEAIHPGDVKLHLIINRWARMPVLFKQRGVTIILKDSVDLRNLLATKPRWVQKLSQEWYSPRKGRWLFVPETVLPVTADDLLNQLNKFYIAEVRGC